ncbi:hypothetical protein [Rhodopseudomonas pseudopalustris]|uniref:Uncharacterized protein n=1 Tax=Rhodopseudomonas pseudopalustris TaxID=1513892 RepID=A0A1H8VAP0_9BRAD|nr:hypothetical protein [Rhodopseudomonas pseudopalustris]SEP12361.1 hypothetical protein SAMN05444123_108158 [Rhodopseudomonas pseudopalustris]
MAEYFVIDPENNTSFPNVDNADRAEVFTDLDKAKARAEELAAGHPGDVYTVAKSIFISVSEVKAPKTSKAP